jgi:uncharacterized protein (DUF885 family)
MGRGCSITLSGVLLAAGIPILALLAKGPPPVSAAPSPAQPQPPQARQPGIPHRSPQLLAILDEHVEFLRRTNPLAASKRGDERFNDQLPDRGPEAVEARRVEIARRLAQLQALSRDGFTEQDHTDADLLAYTLTRSLEWARFRQEQIPISTMGGPQIDLPQMHRQIPFRTPKHYADYAARLEQVPRLIDQTIRQMERGLEEGRLPPRVTLALAVEQALAQATPEIERSPALSPFYQPFNELAQDDPQAERARRAVAEGIIPAYRRLAEFLRNRYIPRARESIAASDGIDGHDLYDQAVRDHTTLDLSAEQVHGIGLEEVARIRAEIERVIDRSDFPGRSAGPSEERFAAFTRYLREDTRFYHSSAEELLDGYRVIAKRIDPELPGLFGHLPRNTYGVRALPAFSAPGSPTAFYYPGSARGGMPGYFMANTYRLDQRPKFSMIALTLHEAVPGHHFQYSIADELEGEHEFRTWIGFTAFGEGWALYAERLGLEMGEPPHGLYADPYDDFGRLNFEMWRACRLVVDTGIHAKGWTRDRAIGFMLANTALARYDVEREVDRYIGWPGQATGYKIGEMKIRELRRRAEDSLLERFDLRSFHDAVLGAGSIPLPVLERRVDRWISQQRSR